MGVLKFRANLRPRPEPSSQAEPLLLEIALPVHLASRQAAVLVGGRYGLGSKELTPNHAVSCFRNLSQETPKQGFTVGIEDGVAHLSLPALMGHGRRYVVAMQKSLINTRDTG